MSRWTQKSADEELRALLHEIPQLSQLQRFSADHTKWVMRALRVLEDVFGQASRYYLSFAALEWGETGSFMVGGLSDPEGVYNPMAAVERRHQQAYVRQLDSAKGFLQAALGDLKRFGLAAVYEGKDTGPESSAILRILNLAERKLRKVVRQPPTREREVQEALENLFVGGEIDYSRETESIEYSSKTYTPDFTFQRIDLALEVKLCNRDDREKEIIAEINDDILAYRTKYRNLVFVVYDLGFIRDVDRFADALGAHEGVVVRVVKH